MTPWLRRRAAVVLLTLIWIVSLLLPSIETAAGPVLSGWDVLARGWRGTADGVLSWWANPVFALALAVLWLRPGRAAAALAGLALALALSSFAAAATARWLGASVPGFRFGPGFYVWLAAHFGLVAASLSRAARRRVGARS